jgi:hypothetical protein
MRKDDVLLALCISLSALILRDQMSSLDKTADHTPMRHRPKWQELGMQ